MWAVFYEPESAFLHDGMEPCAGEPELSGSDLWAGIKESLLEQPGAEIIDSVTQGAGRITLITVMATSAIWKRKRKALSFCPLITNMTATETAPPRQEYRD